MNAKQRLHSWASQWTARRLLADQPLPTPDLPAPEDSATQAGGRFTVGVGGDIARLLLSRLHASITPDDAQKASLGGAFTVSAAGLHVPRVPILRGQIRQLNPELKPEWTRTVIVLVLEVDEGGERALALPWGEFSEPAFDGELATGLKDHGMAVLCVWNAAWMPFTALRRSWWLGDAFDDLLQEATLLHAARSSREPVPATLQERTGPPIVHPLDPRHDYLDGEAGLLEDLSMMES